MEKCFYNLLLAALLWLNLCCFSNFVYRFQWCWCFVGITILESRYIMVVCWGNAFGIRQLLGKCFRILKHSIEILLSLFPFILIFHQFSDLLVSWAGEIWNNNISLFQGQWHVYSWIILWNIHTGMSWTQSIWRSSLTSYSFLILM